MAYLMAGETHVACHRPVAPSDEEWSAYLGHIERHLGRLTGILAFAPGSGPTFAQQRQSAAFWKKADTRPPIAVLTESRLVVRAAGALKWFMPDQIRAFGTWDPEPSFTHARVEPGQRDRVLRVLRGLATKLEVELPDTLA